MFFIIIVFCLLFSEGPETFSFHSSIQFKSQLVCKVAKNQLTPY